MRLTPDLLDELEKSINRARSARQNTEHNVKTINTPPESISDLVPGVKAKITIANTIVPDSDYDLGDEAIDEGGLVSSWYRPGGYATVYFGECWLAVPVNSITHVNGHAVTDAVDRDCCDYPCCCDYPWTDGHSSSCERRERKS